MRILSRFVIYMLVIVIVVIRFFTETLGVLPRFFNAIDLVFIPALIVVALLGRLGGSGRLTISPLIGLFITLFTIVCVVSAALNVEDILIPAVLLFFAGHLLPILLAVAIMNLDLGVQFIYGAKRVFIGLGLLGTVIAFTQVRGLSGNSDALVTTFGTNANQTAFFIALILSLLIARWFTGVASRFEKGFALILTPFFFLAGFKAMWVFYPAAVITTFALLAITRPKAILRAAGMVVGFIFLVILVLVYVPLPEISYFGFFATFDPSQFGKFQVIASLPEVWVSRLWSFLVGIGPGTFTSRAFRTFAALPNRGAATDVTISFIPPTYMTPLADQIVVPLVAKPTWQFGSGTADWPFTSYVSLIAETGILGFISIIGIYGLTWWHLMRVARRSRDREVRSFVIAAAMSLLTLLLVSLMDNYLEHTRLASLTWIMVGIAWYAIRAERAGIVLRPRTWVIQFIPWRWHRRVPAVGSTLQQSSIQPDH